MSLTISRLTQAASLCAAGVLVCTLLTACGSNPQADGGAAASAGNAESTDNTVKTADAEVMSLQQLDQRLAEYHGKVVVVGLWATW